MTATLQPTATTVVSPEAISIARTLGLLDDTGAELAALGMLTEELAVDLRAVGYSATPTLPRDHRGRLLITGMDAGSIDAHVRSMIFGRGRHAMSGWNEVQAMDECRCGCKLYVRRRGAVLSYRLRHHTTYGCFLGRSTATWEVPVSVRPKAPDAEPTELCPKGCGQQAVTGGGHNSGFAGEGVDWANLACGHQIMESGPIPSDLMPW